MELIYSAEPFNFFHPDIHKVIKDYIAKNTEFNQIYKYILTAIQNEKKDEFAIVRYISLEEFTYYFIWTLDSISKVMQITTLHPSHFLYIAHNLRQDLYFMHNMCSETDDFFEPALKGTISTVMHFVVNMMDQMGYSNSSFANALLNNDKSYDFYSIVVNYYHDISIVEATVKSILEGKLHYDLYQLNNIVQTETVKLRVIDTNYIEIATIANAITPANIHHIDVIKSFLSDLLDQSKIDTHAKEQARKQIKEKVDQIKAYNTPQQLFTPQEQTNQTLQPKTEDFIKLLSIPYQNRKEDCKKLLDILTQSGWSKKDHARFALALYKSGNVALQRENIRTFAEWWRICCDIFGWEGADSPYKESQLTPNKATRQISLYL